MLRARRRQIMDFQPYEEEVLTWAKDRLGPRWRARLRNDPSLPRGYGHLIDRPFGIPRWNACFQLARFLVRAGK